MIAPRSEVTWFYGVCPECGRLLPVTHGKWPEHTFLTLLDAAYTGHCPRSGTEHQ